MNSIKCGYCKKDFSSIEALQEHRQSCKRKVIKVGAGALLLSSEPESSGKVFECRNCGASYGSKEGMLIHRNDCF